MKKARMNQKNLIKTEQKQYFKIKEQIKIKIV